MSDLERLARGLMLVGLDALPSRIEHADYAGYLFFARNGESAEALRGLTDALRARYSEGLTPILAIDQEGGRVARLRHGVDPMPSMMAAGAAGDPELTQRAGEQAAFDLRRAGCTVSFAPVLDLAVEPRNTVIGNRSFGEDPQRVAALGSAFARGLERGGITACYKHFPGHGATAVDSHEALPAIELDKATLLAIDLAPFAAVARDAAMMMSAHVLARSLDPERPATLSPQIAGELLREKLGFSGVLATDCLEMHALDAFADAPVRALAAGADLLLFSHDVQRAARAATAVAQAVDAGRLPLSRLKEAHARVLRLRRAGSAPLARNAFPPHPDVGREIARRAITLVRGEPEADPVATFVVSFGGDAAPLIAQAPALEGLSLSPDPSQDELARALEALAAAQRRPLLLSRRAHLHAAQAQAINALVARYPDAVVVSVLEPYDLSLFAGAKHLLAAYGDDAASVGGLADVLFGSHSATGKLPVTVGELS